MIDLKEKVSQATEKGKMLTLRLHCARVEVDKRYKVTSSGLHNLTSSATEVPTFHSSTTKLV